MILQNIHLLKHSLTNNAIKLNENKRELCLQFQKIKHIYQQIFKQKLHASSQTKQSENIHSNARNSSQTMGQCASSIFRRPLLVEGTFILKIVN